MVAAGRQCILKGKKRQRQLEVIAIALPTSSSCPFCWHGQALPTGLACMVASLNFLVSLLRLWTMMGGSTQCFHMSYAVQYSEPTRANICGRRRARTTAGRRTCFAALATEDGLFDRWIEHAVLAWKPSHSRHLRISTWNIPPPGGAPEAAGGARRSSDVFPMPLRGRGPAARGWCRWQSCPAGVVGSRAVGGGLLRRVGVQVAPPPWAPPPYSFLPLHLRGLLAA